MPALGFSKLFVAKVERGEKRQTIRKRRKHPIKVGDTLYLKEGWRTSACRSIGEVVCTETFALLRRSRGNWERVLGKGWANDRFSHLGVEELARRDGFDLVECFEDWFDKHCGPDELLDVIRW